MRVNLSFNPSLYEAMRKDAKAVGLSVSAYIRHMYLTQKEKPKDGPTDMAR